jgi:mannosyltransferase
MRSAASLPLPRTQSSPPVVDSLAGNQSRLPVYLACSLVFVIAVLVRVPSSNESFWLDELHSAWTVWGPLAEVSDRAMAGNQTPVYFWLLWIWKQLVGNSEVALRTPSVICTALASAILTLGLYRTRGSLLTATVAGLVLALDTNAIFFGTELRPFASVMLLAAIACWVSSQPIVTGDRSLLVLVVIMLVAAAFQPTSSVVFVWLLLSRYQLVRSQSMSQAIFRGRPITLIVLLLLIGVAWLSHSVLYEAWQHRAQWSGMGRADSLRQFLNAWPWGMLFLLPLGIFVVAKCLRVDRDLVTSDVPAGSQLPAPWRLPLVAIMAVFCFWLISALGIAPVFHRRYFVASLPILAWGCGELIAKSQDFFRLRPLAIAPILCLLFVQGTAAKLFKGDLTLVRRGEGWREAIDYLHAHTPPGQTVWLDPGLIETRRLLSDTSSVGQEYAQWYLTFPMSGPYPWPAVEAVASPLGETQKRQAAQFPIVSRGTRQNVERMLGGNQTARDAKASIRSFGGVQVLEK